jgi:transcriptional regulator with XRE-family HTH domain
MLTDDLRAARREKGWTQKTLADRIGVDPQMIMRLEQGIGSAKTLSVVMNALDFRLTGIGPGKTLGEQLRALRVKRSLYMDELAQRAGLSRTTLASLERGGGSVAKLMQVLG